MASTFDNLLGKIILHAQLTANEGRADELECVLKNIQAASANGKEPGCLAYRVCRSGNKFFIFEEYVNQDAIKTHFASPAFQDGLVQITNGLTEGGPQITYYEEV